MKKIVEKLKSKKKLFIGIIIGGIFISLVSVAGTIAANTITSNYVLYNSSTGKTNVKDAIDELYTLAINKPDYSKITKIDGTGTNVGDEVAFGTEHFYVLSNDGTKVRLLAKYNLNVGKATDTVTAEVGMQSVMTINNSYIGTVPFADSVYWGGNLSSNKFVYDSRSNLYKYVEAYKTRLKELGLNVIDATIPSFEELTDFRNLYSNKSGNVYDMTFFWTGTAFTHSSGYEGIYTSRSGNAYNKSYAAGIRPIIVVPSSSL